MPRLPRPPVVALCLMAGLVVGLAACGDDDDTADGPTADATVTTSTTSATTAPATTTEPAPTPEQQVEAAYLQAFTAYFNAGVDPGLPSDLAMHFSGAALTAVESNIDRLRQTGLRSDFPKGLPAISVSSVEVTSAQSAALTACLVDEGRKIVIAEGSITDDLPTSRLTSAELENSDGTWKVVSHNTVAEWENASGCDQ